MGDIKKLNSFYTPIETMEEELEEMKKNQNIDGVIILSLTKEGKQRMVTSHFNFEKKCFLKCFFDSLILEWFKPREER